MPSSIAHIQRVYNRAAVRRGRPADIKPFWVADMDFEVPPELKQILLERVNHGVF